jgi:hypothetical protein
MVTEELSRLERLAGELAASEVLASPLRRRLQSVDRDEQMRAREAMASVGLMEADLCAAWHHLPRERRGFIVESLRKFGAP